MLSCTQSAPQSGSSRCPTPNRARTSDPASETSHHDWHALSADEVLQILDSNQTEGLTDENARTRLREIGPNELVERRGRGPLVIIWDQVSSTMVLILIAAAVISGFLRKTTETLAIAAIVVLFALLGFIQEYRAEKAMAALKRWLSQPVCEPNWGGSRI